jgi:hypothetical protein
MEVGFGQRQRLIDPQPGAPEHDDQAGEKVTVASSLSLTYDRDDLLDCGRVSRVAPTLLRGGLPARNSGIVAGERRRPAASISG